MSDEMADDFEIWTLEDVGRAMVAMTTTVRGPDEWACIPALWKQCMDERDALRANKPTEAYLVPLPGRVPDRALFLDKSAADAAAVKHHSVVFRLVLGD